MNNIFNNNKGYSILSVIFVMVSIIIAMSIWIFSGQSNASTIDSEDLIIESLLNDSSSIKTEYDKLLSSGNSSSKIIFIPNVLSTPLAPNILDAANGMSYPKVNPKILKSNLSIPKGIWFRNR